jgi:hypothetical protein
MLSPPAVPITTSRSLVSPRVVAISMFDVVASGVAPGSNFPPVWSSTSRSFEPAAPAIETVSVFVVVAPPQATGLKPNQSCPATTFSVALEPGSTDAVTDLAAGS